MMIVRAPLLFCQITGIFAFTQTLPPDWVWPTMGEPTSTAAIATTTTTTTTTTSAATQTRVTTSAQVHTTSASGATTSTTASTTAATSSSASSSGGTVSSDSEVSDPRLPPILEVSTKYQEGVKPATMLQDQDGIEVVLDGQGAAAGGAPELPGEGEVQPDGGEKSSE